MNLESLNMVGRHKRFSISWTSLWMEVNRMLFWILLLWCPLTKYSFSSLFSACHRVWFSQTSVYFASQGNMQGTVFHILNASIETFLSNRQLLYADWFPWSRFWLCYYWIFLAYYFSQHILFLSYFGQRFITRQVKSYCIISYPDYL